MSYPFSRVLCCQKPFTDPLSAEYSRSREDYSGSRVPSGRGHLQRLVSSSRQWLCFHLHRFHVQRAEDGRHGLLDIHHQHSVIFQQTVLTISSTSKILTQSSNFKFAKYLFKISIYASYSRLSVQSSLQYSYFISLILLYLFYKVLIRKFT